MGSYLELKIPIRQRPYRHRIVEVARRFAVDSDNRQGTIVVAMSQLFRGKRVLKLLGLL